MSTKQLLAEIERGMKALEKARVLCLKGEVFSSKAKPTATKASRATAPRATERPAKKAAKGGMSAEGRAKIVAAQQKRWAKVKREKSKAAKAAKTALALSAGK